MNLAFSKFFTAARRTYAAFRTRTVAAAIAAFDTFFFRRELKQQLRAQTGYVNMLEDRIKALNRDETTARAQLCRLRVIPESVAGRTGFMVSAFVPTDVLRRLKNSTPSELESYREKVVGVLVGRALDGLLRVTKRGNNVATIFEPIGSQVGITQVFETPDGKTVAVPIPAASLEVRLIQQAEFKHKQRIIDGLTEQDRSRRLESPDEQKQP